MTEPTELLACPFCSGVAHIADDLITFYGECGTCGATSDYSSYKAGAVAKWNRRTPTPQATKAQAGAVPLTDGQVESLLYKYGYDPDDEHMAAMLKEANGIKGGQHGAE